jgi:hypothetical protein
MKIAAEVKPEVTMVRICMFCAKVFVPPDRWEKNIPLVRTARVSHGLCPQCLKAHYGFEAVPGK